jgi:hypothetical protein
MINATTRIAKGRLNNVCFFQTEQLAQHLVAREARCTDLD